MNSIQRLTEDIRALTGPEELPSSWKNEVFQRIESEPSRVETNAAGELISLNPAFSQMCGYSFAEIGGRKPGQVLQGPKSDPRAVDEMRQAVHNGKSCRVKLINYHKSGVPYGVEISLEPIRNEEGELTGFRAEEREIALD